jgi:hypothetical protein
LLGLLNCNRIIRLERIYAMLATGIRKHDQQCTIWNEIKEKQGKFISKKHKRILLLKEP